MSHRRRRAILVQLAATAICLWGLRPRRLVAGPPAQPRMSAEAKALLDELLAGEPGALRARFRAADATLAGLRDATLITPWHLCAADHCHRRWSPLCAPEDTIEELEGGLRLGHRSPMLHECVVALFLRRFAREKEPSAVAALATTLGGGSLRDAPRVHEALVARLETADDEALTRAILGQLIPLVRQSREPTRDWVLRRIKPRSRWPAYLSEPLVGRLGRPALVAKLAASQDRRTRREAASLLGLLPAPAARNALAKLAFDDSAGVRAAASQFLDVLGGDLALADVARLSRDPVETVRYHATVELAKRNTPEAVPALIDRVLDPATYCPGMKAASIPRIANAAREGLYRLTGLHIPHRETKDRRRRSYERRRLAELWQKRKGGRRVDWLLAAFAESCREQRTPVAAVDYSRPSFRNEGDPAHPLAAEILPLISQADARAWLADPSPEKRTLALLYASRHHEELRDRGQLLAAVKALLRLHCEKRALPRRERPERVKPAYYQPMVAEDPLWDLMFDVDRGLLRSGVLKLLPTLELETDDLERVHARLLPFLPPPQAPAQDGMATLLAKLEEKEGAAWDRLFARLERHAHGPVEARSFPRGQAFGIVHSLAPHVRGDPRLLAMIRSEKPAVRHAIFFAIVNRYHYQTKRMQVAAGEALAAARACLADPDPVVRKGAVMIVAQAGELDDLFRFAAGGNAALVGASLRRLRSEFWKETWRGKHARQFALAVLEVCRSKDRDLRILGFRNSHGVREHCKEIYDPGLFVGGLEDPSPVVRTACIRMVHAAGSPQEKLKLAPLIEDEDPHVRQALCDYALDKTTAPQLVHRIAARAHKLDAKEIVTLAQRPLPVADDRLARAALRVLLRRTEGELMKKYHERDSLVKMIWRSPRALSETDAVRLALIAPRSTAASRRALEGMSGPKFARIAVRGLTREHMCWEAAKALHRYFPTGGPEAWRALAESWLDLSTRRGYVIQELLKNDNGFRAWLSEQARDPKNMGACVMALEYNHRLRPAEAPVPIADLLPRTKALIDSGRDVGPVPAAALALAFLDVEDAMAVWNATVVGYGLAGNLYHTCGLESTLRRNPALFVPLVRERLAASDPYTAGSILRTSCPGRDAPEVRAMLHGLLDGEESYARTVAIRLLLHRGDLAAAEKLAEDLFAGKGLLADGLPALRYSRSQAVKQWLEQTRFVERAVSTRAGFSTWGAGFLKERGMAGVEHIAKGTSSAEVVRRLLEKALERFPIERLLELGQPRLSRACLERILARQGPGSYTYRKKRGAPARTGFDDPPAPCFTDAVPRVMVGLAGSEDPRTAGLALAAIAGCAGGNAILRWHVRSPDPWVAAHAAAGLARFRDAADAAALAGALRHRDQAVRAVAAWVLGLNGGTPVGRRGQAAEANT